MKIAALLATTLFSALPCAVALTPVCAAHAQSTAPQSSLAEVSVPKGAERVNNKNLSAGLGRLLADGAKEFKLPPRNGGPGNAEVYSWTGSNYKDSRVPFMRTVLQNALEEAGYTVRNVDGSSENTPNAFDGEAYATEPLQLSSADGRHQYFYATNPKAGKTIVGVWFHISSQSRLVLALSLAGGVDAPTETHVPDVTGPDMWLVKDLKNATKGMPAPLMPSFPAVPRKPRTVRGLVKDGSGRPIANAHIIAQASAAGGFRTSFKARSNAQGLYEIPLPVGICQVVNADCKVEYNGETYLMPLHPADGTRDNFDSGRGHVENFVLRSSGSAGESGGNYGAPIRIITRGTTNGSTVEVVLKPVGPLLDGSKGKTLVVRYPGKEHLAGFESFLAGIPVGHYTLTAKVYDGDDALPLRARKTFGENTPLGKTLDVSFESEHSGTLATLGQSGIKRFEVILEP